MPCSYILSILSTLCIWFFFFSSRRRHTRCSRDWSSDVCSSDLRMELVEARGQFAVRGGILDVFPAHLDVPVRAEWFGDEIESLREFDPTTQRSTRSIPAALLTSVREAGGNATVLDYLPPSSVLMLDEPDELQRQARTLWEHAAPATLVSWEDLLRRAHATVRLSLSALHAAENGKAEIPMRFTGVEALGCQMQLLARAREERQW